MKIERYLYEHFGAAKPTGFFDQTQTYKKVHSLISGAVEDAQWIAIFGQIMSGKTSALEHVLQRVQQQRKQHCRFVNLYWPERKGINIAEILNQIIYTLGEEFLGTQSPRRGKEIRMLQVLQILCEAKYSGLHVVLLIDEAHELHLATLKALKRLWEYKFKGESDLITIVLTGQESLEHKIQADREIRKRIIQMPFDYPASSRAQIAKYIGGGLVSNEIANELGSRFEQVGDIVHAIREAMLNAEMLGESELKVTDFPWLREQKKPTRKGEKVTLNSNAIEALESKFGVKSISKDGTNG